MKKVIFIKPWKDGRVPIGMVSLMTKEKMKSLTGTVVAYSGPVAEGYIDKNFKVKSKNSK